MRPLTPSAVYDAWIRYFGMRHLPTKSIGGLSERLDPGPPLPPRGPDGRGGGATLGGGGAVVNSGSQQQRVPLSLVNENVTPYCYVKMSPRGVVHGVGTPGPWR